MKIVGIIEPAEFFEKVLDCTGSVELYTSEGDVLNLKMQALPIHRADADV